MKDFKNKSTRKSEDENSTKKKIMLIILLIIMLLSLITSCSCTSNFFGKIGSLIENIIKQDIDDKTDTLETILNKDLKFDTDYTEISIDDNKTKIGFTYKNISPKELTCSTNDASIATCYVVDDYVVINPHKAGKVTVTLETKTNGKIYKATTIVNINDTDRYIALSSYAGTINLAYGKNRSITYSLVGLTGDVTVNSSDESIATVTIKDGVIRITAKKVGNVTITVSIEYNGKTYTKEYELTVIKDKNAGSGNTKPDNDSNNPTDKKDNVSTLSGLTTNKGTLTPEFSSSILEYNIGVSWWVWSLTLDATATNSNVQNKIIYSYKRADKDNFETINSLKDLKLKTGDNIVLITVTAEDGSKTIYKVTINRAYNNYLENLTTSVGTLTPKFDKHTTGYSIEVPASTNNITLEATPKNKRAEVTYTFNGVTRSNLEDLYLVTGPNIVTITVKHGNNTRTYKVIINKLSGTGETDNNSLLTSLVIDGKDQLNFNPFIKEYHIGVDYGTEKLLFSASSSSPNAKISYTYNGITTTGNNVHSLLAENLQIGDNKVIVTVTNGNESTEYVVIVNRASNPYTGEGSNTLDNIKVLGNVGKLNPEFDPNTLEYNVEVGKDVTNIDLSATAGTGTKISYCFNGVCKDGGDISIKDLAPGNNKVIIKATDGLGNTRDYIVNINREQDSETIKDLTLVNVKVNGILAEKYLSDNTYKIEVKTDKANLLATPTNPNATITYTYNNKTLNKNSDGSVDISDLKNGANIVTVTVSMNGESKSYNVIIDKKGDEISTNVSTLDIFNIGNISVINGGNVEFTDGTQFETVVVPTDELSTVVYYVNGTAYNSLSAFNTAIKNAFNSLNKGETLQVSVKVTSQDGTTSNNYSASITKKDDSEPVDPSDKISIKFDGEEMPSIGGYLIGAVDSFNKTNIPITVTGSTNVKYKLCNEDKTSCSEETTNLNSLKLNPGWNILTIIVEEDGVTKSYEVKIFRPTREIIFESTSYTCMENSTCENILFKIKETKAIVNNMGVTLVPNEIDYKDDKTAYEGIDITIDPNTGLTIKENNIIVTPNNVGTYTLTAKKTDYTQGSATLTVKEVTAEDYILNAQSPEYIVKITKNPETNFKDVILETTLFKGKELDTSTANSNGDIVWKNGTLEICSKGSSSDRVCIVITPEDPTKISKLSFNSKGELSPDYLPIKVVGATEGETNLNIEGIVNGKKVITTSTKLIIKKTYTVTLEAGKAGENEGYFYKTLKEDGTYEYTRQYFFDLEENDELNLINSIKPLVEDTTDGKCNYFYTLLGYKGSNGIDYTLNELSSDTYLIKNLTADLTLTAYYSTDSKPQDTGELKNKILWLENVPIFGTREDENKPNLIYPGAKGSYTAWIKNTSNYTLYLTGLILQENPSVCPEVGKCLNMGYIVKATDPENDRKSFYYYKGQDFTDSFTSYADRNYGVLNKAKTTELNDAGNQVTTDGKIKVNFRDFQSDSQRNDKENIPLGKSIEIAPGEEKDIALLWKWVELDDTVDTIIGKYVAEGGNNIYNLTFGIEYLIETDDCNNN